ncbi:Arginyl-tRNA--protein transferase 1 [Tolypocladium paradoxum]|uniref:arginyltransferase n=1 Tax=Tolypocladium paradoxum TaxID=94208 RepID=A0A2S4L3U6_9HYPO|nr:Arginyl-tRNA--protein transferase 1 [Tolypocladium paradoxum]
MMEPSGSQTPEGAFSDYEFLSPIGYANSSRCGYCGNRDPRQSKRFSYYATATSLSPKFYQTLLDRCWRRSGTLLYRPNQRQACCPHYTLRLDSTRFKPSRDQRQTVNRFNRYVLGESYIKEAARRYPRSRQEAKKRDNEFCLIERVHEAELANLKTPPEPAHKLVVTLDEDTFTEEKYRVYDNYQKVVHNEAPKDRTRRSFKRFLCSSPLRRQVTTAPDGRKRRLGSYHHCYRIDGELVAIGVLDLLPECVSSVYFLYHESIHKYTPGKLGAVYEIALAVEQGYRWWYPGFYIHNCPKMRYKIDYSPQYILDPQALSWDPLDKEALSILDKKPFVSLSLERQAASDGRGEGLEPINNPDSTKVAAATDGANSDDDEASVSLFQSDMPGIPSIEDMETVDLDHIALKIFPSGPLFETSDLVSWDSKNITDWPSIKASVAELVAALGPDLAGSICLDSSSRE